jgi:hypothetical protein
MLQSVSQCSLQRDPERPSQPYASPGTQSMSRPCNFRDGQFVLVWGGVKGGGVVGVCSNVAALEMHMSLQQGCGLLCRHGILMLCLMMCVSVMVVCILMEGVTGVWVAVCCVSAARWQGGVFCGGGSEGAQGTRVAVDCSRQSSLS